MPPISMSSKHSNPYKVPNYCDSMTEIHVNSCTHQEEFEDTKGVIKIRKSKKDKHHNGYGQKKKYKRTNNDL
jgi:hypothetical protein